jgi:hypothetical protein
MIGSTQKLNPKLQVLVLFQIIYLYYQESQGEGEQLVQQFSAGEEGVIYGTIEDMVKGMIMGFLLGLIMLLWLTDTSLPVRTRIGIVFGIGVSMGYCVIKLTF